MKSYLISPFIFIKVSIFIIILVIFNPLNISLAKDLVPLGSNSQQVSDSSSSAPNPLACLKSDFQFKNIKVPQDFCLGNPNAKVIIIDYSSFTCGHCSDFYQHVLLKIKQKYIDTGKVLLIMRDFPLDEVSLKGSMLVKCYEEISAIGKDTKARNSRNFSRNNHNNYNQSYNNNLAANNLVNNSQMDPNYFEIIRQLFDISIGSRNKSEFTEKLYVIAQQSLRMEKPQVDACLNNETIRDKILSSKLFALKAPEINIRGTPTIFINGNKYSGVIKIAELERILESYLQE